MSESGEQLRFDGRVVVVTGAGAGLGRAYALLFASRGASVVVNDLGGSRSGDGSSTNAADAVVNEIKKLGGIAVADYNSVVDGEKIIKTALDNFGKIDVLVNNAGILRDKSFSRISDTDWDLVTAVHLKGAFKTSQAAWPIFRKQNYGRIIVTSSAAGLFGNFGQANYSAAKMGLVGLCNTMAIEGRKNNIHTNVLVPTAASRLTEDILPPDLFKELKPELIAPVVVWLCHETCEENGSIIETAAGWATKYGLIRGQGSLLRQNMSDSVFPEDVQKRWNEITDLTESNQLASIQDTVVSLMEQLDNLKTGSVATTQSKKSYLHNITFKDCILYSLAIGATVRATSDMKYLYEHHEQFSAFPTMAIIPGVMALFESNVLENALPGKSVDLSQILHGEQYLEVFQPLPTNETISVQCYLIDVIDKGKHAVAIIGCDSFNSQGIKISNGQVSVFIIGAGGFSGKRQCDNYVKPLDPPSRAPDSIVEQTTSQDQGALYRLTGDLNPLHIDSNFAAISGYQKPILHGLCSLGFSARHVLAKYGNNDPANFKAIKCRFSKPVLPGDVLKTEMWKDGKRIYFRTSVLSGDVVITGAYVDLQNIDESSTATTMNSENVNDELKIPSDVIFQTMASKLQASPELTKSVNGVFFYKVTDKQKVVKKKWTCDFIRGEVYVGEPKSGVKVDTFITVSDEDLILMALGKIGAQEAFLKGKINIKGNIMLTKKLGDIMKSGAKY